MSECIYINTGYYIFNFIRDTRWHAVLKRGAAAALPAADSIAVGVGGARLHTLSVEEISAILADRASAGGDLAGGDVKSARVAVAYGTVTLAGALV